MLEERGKSPGVKIGNEILKERIPLLLICEQNVFRLDSNNACRVFFTS